MTVSKEARTKYTPGPWAWIEAPFAGTPGKIWDGVSGIGKYPSFDMLLGDGGKSVLHGVWCNDSTAEVGVSGEADARLIFAAPELAEALLGVYEELREVPASVFDHFSGTLLANITRSLRKAGIL